MASPGNHATCLLCLLLLTFLLDIVCSNQDAVGGGPLLEDPVAVPTKPSTSEPDESLLSNSDSLPIFLMEPKDTYVVKNRPATLQCRAAHTLQMYFKCNGARKFEGSQSEFVDPMNGVRIMEYETNITRNMVEEFFGKERFKCECYAWNGRGDIKSQPATVEYAYLKKQFEMNPISTNVDIGQQTELRCVAPIGLPPPRIYWLKNGQPLQPDTSVIVTSEGHLLIGQARPLDTGNYSCVAENIASKRIASPAQITVVENTSNDPNIIDGELDDENVADSILWLKNNTEPWTMITTKWSETYDNRRKDFLNSEDTIETYFNKYPAIKTSLGYTLIDYDFSKLFNGHENKLFAEWNKLSIKIISLATKRNVIPKHFNFNFDVLNDVEGGWSSWTPWTECHCPGGALPSGKKRTRTCTNPPPSNGGLECQGVSLQKTKECQTCPQEELVVDTIYEFDDNDLSFVEPRWTPWSEWSECSSNCTKIRRRQCNNLGSTRRCSGKDIHAVSCSSEVCPSTQLAGVKESNLADTQSDLAVYIGLAGAIFVVTLLSFFLVRLYRRKGQHQSLYNMANNDYHPEFFPEHDKKSLSLQPDLTQTVPPCYEYPFTTPATSVTRSVSEHHYDVPHLASASDIQMSPATSSTLESSSGKRSQLSGFTNNSDSTYEVATESVTLPLPALPTAYAVTPTGGNYTSAAVTQAGAHLILPESSVSLIISEGAVSRGRKQELFLSILNEDCFRPKLAENVTQLSPVVSCGPNVSLNKSVVLKIPHCAELNKNKKNSWLITVLQSDCSDSQWQTAVTLGQETINTSVFCQLDQDAAYLMTDCLSRFVIVGHSIYGEAVKRLKLAIFAPKLCLSASVDYSVRVYVLEDTDSSMETVFGQEKRLGGFLMDQPREILFTDGGANLCLNLESVSEGWKCKPGSSYQEIPFKHLWQANSNSLHCSFTLESHELCRKLNFKLRVNQKGYEGSQFFDVICKDDVEFTNRTNSAKLYHETVPKVMIQSETSRSNESKVYKQLSQDDFTNASNNSTSNSKGANVSQKSAKNIILTDRGVSTCDDFNFRLSRSVRKQLCQCLDPPTSRGNDWRMLAHALSVDRYINYFATKPSPTDCILDLWEARNRQSNALTDIVKIFKDMDRFDAAKVLENSLGSNWL